MLKKTADEVAKQTFTIQDALLQNAPKDFQTKQIESDKKSKNSMKESSKSDDKRSRLESLFEEKSGSLGSKKSTHDPAKEKEKIQSTISRLNKNDEKADEGNDFFSWKPAKKVASDESNK
jgi:hypothetical protein